MISALERFDKVTAGGILARAALAIDGNPAGAYSLPGEQSVREQVIREVLATHGLPPGDQTAHALNILNDALDEELDSLIAPRDPAPILARLSERGELPSDLFEIEIIPQLAEFHGRRYAREQKLIQETVRFPDREQHYGQSEDADSPWMISLFTKHYPDQYPMRSFVMLVAGQRHGLKLNVHQAWRVYPDIPGHDAPTLVDLLRRFSDHFGHEMKVGDKRGHFILAADFPPGTREIEAEWFVAPKPGAKPGHQRKHLTFSWFTTTDPKTRVLRGALMVSIDLDKYRAFLEAHGY